MPATAFLPSPPAAVRCPAATGAAAAGAEVAGPAARRWVGLAVGSLVIAGLLSLFVVIGRIPVISRAIADPLFFKRCLVVHVDLALVVWFYAFLSGLVALGRAPGGRLAQAAFAGAVGGVGAMLAGALMHGAAPVLANYVPVIDHPLFLGGLAAFFLGTLFFLLDALGRPAVAGPGRPPADAVTGWQAAAVAYVLAGATWVATRAALPEGLETWTRFEFAAWGAGHVLQVANAAAMLGVWLWLLERAAGRPVLSARAARGVFTVLLAPHFAMPLLTARGALHPLYHDGATQLMRWGIFPVVAAMLILGVRHLRRPAGPAPAGLAALARAGFAASAGLTVLGLVLGACIRSSTTLVPAHYHASLGGVTVAFMTAAYLVAAAIRPAGVGRLAAAGRRQLVWFGAGQSVFALGFGLGGLYGLGRKAYAAEQQVRSAGEYAGLAVMGLGGLIATAAGLWFLFLILREMRGWWGRGSAPAAAAPILFP
ncbi:MAG: hypothetical protein HZC55_04370 [Verrucomicrobia bacterium]|nr:hypothetical protein [Verrucomicrobiota bacterium]